MAGLTAAELEAVVGVDDSMFDKGLDSMLETFKGWGGKAKAIMGGIGVIGGGLFATGLAGGLNLDKAKGRLQAQLGLTADEADKYGKIAGKVYADNWGESIDEVTDSIGTVIASFPKLKHASDSVVQDATEKALIYAQTFGVDVTRAVNVAAVAVKSGLAKNATQAFDMLTKASQKVSPELREPVLDAVEEYSQFFNQLGISGPKAFGLLVQGAQKGQFGIDKVGDSIKEFGIRASDLSDTGAQQALRRLGLDAKDTASDMLEGGKTAQKATHRIVEGLLDVDDPAKQAKLALALFGTPMEDLGKGAIPKFLKTLAGAGGQLKDFKGATDKAGDALSDNAGANLESFIRKLKVGLVQTIGGAVVPVIEDWSDKLGPLVGDIQNVVKWIAKHKTAAMVLTGVIAALVAVTEIHAAVMAVQAAGGLAAYLKGTKLVTAATKVWTAVQWAMNAALTANPIGIVIAVIAALVVGIVIAYKKSETFRKICQAAFKAVAAAGRWMWNNVLQPAFHFLIEAIATVLEMWSKMLGALGHIPGFGWAKDASRVMHDAAEKARDLGDKVTKIPNHADVTVTSNLPAAIRDLDAYTRRLKALNNSVAKTYIRQITTKGPVAGGGHPVPAFASGGRVVGPTLALIGEGREAESVLPDSLLRGLLEKAHDAGASTRRRGSDDERRALMRDAIFNLKGDETLVRDLFDELDHFLRVADFGGKYVGAGA